MVELFFVISGFVIFNAYSEKINSRNDLLKFQFLRFARLYPVHLIFLFLFLLIEIGKYLAVSQYEIQNIRVIPFGENNIEALIEQVFLLQSVLPNGHAITFNGPAWSISVEFYTYLVFGLIILFFKRNKTMVISLLCAIPIFLLITKTTFGMENMLRCLAGFFLGCLTAHVLKQFTIILPKYTSLLLFLSIGVYLQIKKEFEFDFLIFFLTALLIASLVLNANGWLNGILSKKPLIWLGELSYSVYMSQEFVIWGITNFIRRILKLPEIQGANGFWTTPLTLFETMATISLTIIIMLLVSQAVYLLIEKPLRDKSRKLILKNQVKPDGIHAIKK